jgi:sulfatase modifying factor 1
MEEKRMKRMFVAAAVVALLCLCVAAHADVFNLGPGLTNLEMVTVGDPGNAADTRYNGISVGSVGYAYSIGKYEVTTAQYVDFLNHKAQSDPYGLWQGGASIQRRGLPGSYSYTVYSGSSQDVAAWGNRPAFYVSFWSACRFVNWLGNGQGSGDTENGAYTLNGYNGTDGRTIQRNAGWKWALPSENEWYKAAYYDPNKPGGAGYWDYGTRSNILPANEVLAADPGNSANYYTYRYSIGSPYYRTNVGEFENSASAYGTFDQSGNVWELNETIIDQTDINHTYRGVRGGSYYPTGNYLAAYTRGDCGTWAGLQDIGFRVAAVPEPSSIIALAGGLAGLFGIRRRKV